MLMLMRKWEQHKTSKWVRSFAYAYAYVTGVLTCLCLCYAYARAYAYALVKTSLNVLCFCLFMPTSLFRGCPLIVVAHDHETGL